MIPRNQEQVLRSVGLMLVLEGYEMVWSCLVFERVMNWLSRVDFGF